MSDGQMAAIGTSRGKVERQLRVDPGSLIKSGPANVWNRRRYSAARVCCNPRAARSRLRRSAMAAVQPIPDVRGERASDPGGRSSGLTGGGRSCPRSGRSRPISSASFRPGMVIWVQLRIIARMTQPGVPLSPEFQPSSAGRGSPAADPAIELGRRQCFVSRSPC
jgi:hypothetical protein